jgi:hypothetical protein
MLLVIFGEVEHSPALHHQYVFPNLVFAPFLSSEVMFVANDLDS